MALLDMVLNGLLWLSFVVAPLSAIGFVVVGVGLWRNRRRAP